MSYQVLLPAIWLQIYFNAVKVLIGQIILVEMLKSTISVVFLNISNSGFRIPDSRFHILDFIPIHGESVKKNVVSEVKPYRANWLIGPELIPVSVAGSG